MYPAVHAQSTPDKSAVIMGCGDVVIIEKGELTSGSTWHAAGLVGQLRSHRNVTRMLQHSVSLYETLEAETGTDSDSFAGRFKQDWRLNPGMLLTTGVEACFDSCAARASACGDSLTDTPVAVLLAAPRRVVEEEVSP